MDTNELIRALGADAKVPPRRLSTILLVAVAGAAAMAAVEFLLLAGPRADIAEAAETPRFLFKFVVTLALAVTALGVLRPLAYPEMRLGSLWRLLLVAPLLAFMAAAMELVMVPRGLWMPRLVGTNSLLCLTLIPAIGLVPLALLIAALRQAAPSSPASAGMVAGLLAGGMAASFYAAHCFDDSPLFVITWYSLAVAILALLGAVAGRVALRW